MKVLNILDTEHTLIIIPRYYPVGNVNLELFNKETEEVLNYQITPIISDGYMYLTFTENFLIESFFRIKISENSEIVYRGNLHITDQTDLQNYQLTKDIFTL